MTEIGRTSELLTAARGTAAADLVWRARDGALAAVTAAPLVRGQSVAFALPIADVDMGRSLAEAGRAWLLCLDGRSAAQRWRPAAAPCDVRVDVDLDGAWLDGPWVTEGLLAQLCDKDPAARAALESPLVRREHWWAVPRVLLTATPTAPPRRPPPRFDSADATIVSGDGTPVGAARADTWDHPVVDLSGRDHEVATLPAGARVGAVLTAPPTPLGVPRSMLVRGVVEGDRLVVTDRVGRLPSPADRTILGRWRAQRRHERACRRTIARLERGLDLQG